MKQKISIWITLIAIAPALAFGAQTARAYGKSGTASNTNAVITVPFNPTSVVICDDEAAGGTSLYADITDGVAVAADDSTNVIIKGGECLSIKLDDKSVLNTFAVGLITSSSTAAYRLMAFR